MFQVGCWKFVWTQISLASYVSSREKQALEVWKTANYVMMSARFFLVKRNFLRFIKKYIDILKPFAFRYETRNLHGYRINIDLALKLCVQL